MSDGISYDAWKAKQTPELRAAIHEEYLKLLEEEEDLKAVRQRIQQTQEEVAARLGITQGAVSKLERTPNPSIRNIRTLVRQLGGQIDVIVRIPGMKPIRINSLSDLAAAPATSTVTKEKGPDRPKRSRKPDRGSA